MANGMLSQQEIDELLRGTLEPEPEQETSPAENTLTEIEKDALGEIGNISMGTAATTLSQLLGKQVEITTPRVDLMSSDEIRKDYPVPSVVCDVKYKEGIEGSNLLILSQRDGSVIVDLMMGGDGKNPSQELSELQISGISEAMNQMMGSAATSMSTMFNTKVDITPPDLLLNDLSSERDIIGEFMPSEDSLVRISFRMVVEDVIDSTLVQVLPLSVAKGMVNKLMGGMSGGTAAAPAAQATPSMQMPPPPMAASMHFQPPPPAPPPAYDTSPYGSATGYQSYGTAAQGNPQARTQMPVQPAQFAPLQLGHTATQPDNLNLILDVTLQISVELGRAKKTIREILEMGPGSIIELDRLAGESVDMIVNGKLIAKCEVVVINEMFGIRVTDIINPLERMNSLR